MDETHLVQGYDFVESTILEVVWKRTFRDLQVAVDYYWDRSDAMPRRPSALPQPMTLTFTDCIWAAFETSRDFVEASIDYVPEAMTIIAFPS